MRPELLVERAVGDLLALDLRALGQLELAQDLVDSAMGDSHAPVSQNLPQADRPCVIDRIGF